LAADNYHDFIVWFSSYHKVLVEKTPLCGRKRMQYLERRAGDKLSLVVPYTQRSRRLVWNVGVILIGVGDRWDGVMQARLNSSPTLTQKVTVHSEFLRMHFQPFGSTPTTLSQAERGKSHVT